MNRIFATIVTLIVVSVPCFGATVGFSDVPLTNIVKTDDLILIDSDLGGGNYATRTATFLSAQSASSLWTNNAGVLEPSPNSTDTMISQGSAMYLDGRITSVARLQAYDNSGVFAFIQVDPTYDDYGAGVFVMTQGVRKLFMAPFVFDGTIPYQFDTSVSHTSGNLMEVRNMGTNKFTVDYEGNASIGGTVTLAGTTNQVVFGATNSVPVSSAAPDKWISVQVTGESTVYRLPLYK